MKDKLRLVHEQTSVIFLLCFSMNLISCSKVINIIQGGDSEMCFLLFFSREEANGCVGKKREDDSCHLFGFFIFYYLSVQISR